LKGDRVENGIAEPSCETGIPFDDDGLGEFWHTIAVAGQANPGRYSVF
jgi:hypothetical protein